VGFNASVLKAGGLTVSVADVLVSPRYVPDIVPVAVAETGIVVTVKVAVVAPAGMVTLMGTVAAVFVVLNATVSAAAVAPVKVTVPVEEAPPIKVLGASPIELNAGGLTVSVADVFTTEL
jgi:hypothetical protein